MSPLGGVLVAAALVLLGSGAAKIARPEPTRQALFAQNLPSSVAVVVAIGVAELAIGATTLVLPGAVPAAAVAALYLGFAGFVVASMRSGSAAGCGCFGAASSVPPGPLHLVVNLGFAAAAVASWSNDTSVVDLVAEDVTDGLAVIVTAALVALLATAVLTVLPSNRAARL